MIRGMMIKNRVAEVAKAKGIPNAYVLMRDSGISTAVVYSLWNGEAKGVSLETLDRLCALLKAHPGELFEYREERERKAAAGMDILGRKVKPAIPSDKRTPTGPRKRKPKVDTLPIAEEGRGNWSPHPSGVESLPITLG
jgi:DNA-binding Xre family transcriptional regulator